MSDGRDSDTGKPIDASPSDGSLQPHTILDHVQMEQVAELDAYLDRLVADRRVRSKDSQLSTAEGLHHDSELTDAESRQRILAAQLRLAREGVELPSPAFLQSLEKTVGDAVAKETHRRRRPGLSRGKFLQGIATLAGGVGLGVAGVEGVVTLQNEQRPHTLVVAGNDRWYDVAAVDDVPPGGIKAFSAGGLLGFLLNDNGELHAVSGICTHMGCRLKPTDSTHGPADLHCLCHASRFTRRGAVTQGLAPSSLPRIDVRIEQGRVLALGTRETV